MNSCGAVVELPRTESWIIYGDVFGNPCIISLVQDGCSILTTRIVEFRERDDVERTYLTSAHDRCFLYPRPSIFLSMHPSNLITSVLSRLYPIPSINVRFTIIINYSNILPANYNHNYYFAQRKMASYAALKFLSYEYHMFNRVIQYCGCPIIRRSDSFDIIYKK